MPTAPGVPRSCRRVYVCLCLFDCRWGISVLLTALSIVPAVGVVSVCGCVWCVVCVCTYMYLVRVEVFSLAPHQRFVGMRFSLGKS